MSRPNPELSVLNEKNELKKLDGNVGAMRSRVELLRQQLQKEKDNVKKNKQLTKDAIQKKVEVNKIQQWKIKDASDEMDRVESQRRRNQDMRMSHEKELQDIQKAIYLVKLDDAREVKNISMEHSRKIRAMEEDFLHQQRQRKKRVQEDSHMAKERYQQFWKDKLTNIYTEQAQTIVKVGKEKEAKQQEMGRLEEEEMRLMQEINKYHSQSMETKKEYLAALSLPVKDVAEAMGQGGSLNNKSVMSRRKSMTVSNATIEPEQLKSSRRYMDSETRMPAANVNHDKLKVILNQLKKIDRSSARTSR